MGRGRQKAKQTKVARKLKYYSPATDYQELERELSSSKPAARQESAPEAPAEDAPEDDERAEDYAAWAAAVAHGHH